MFYLYYLNYEKNVTTYEVLPITLKIKGAIPKIFALKYTKITRPVLYI